MEVRAGAPDGCDIGRTATHCRTRIVRHLNRMASDHSDSHAFTEDSGGPILNEATRLRLGRQLQALYEPVVDEPLDPRLAELLQQLDSDRGQ